MAAKAEIGNQMPTILPIKLCAPFASQNAMQTSQLAMMDLTTTCAWTAFLLLQLACTEVLYHVGQAFDMFGQACKPEAETDAR